MEWLFIDADKNSIAYPIFTNLVIENIASTFATRRGKIYTLFKINGFKSFKSPVALNTKLTLVSFIKRRFITAINSSFDSYIRPWNKLPFPRLFSLFLFVKVASTFFVCRISWALQPIPQAWPPTLLFGQGILRRHLFAIRHKQNQKKHLCFYFLQK